MSDPVTIIVAAGQHSYSGLLDNRGLRVSDILNEPGTEFLRLTNVTLHQRFFEHVSRLPEVTIPKNGIDMVLLEQGRYEAPLRRQHARIEKRSFSAIVVLSDYEVRGTIMLKGAPDGCRTDSGTVGIFSGDQCAAYDAWRDQTTRTGRSGAGEQVEGIAFAHRPACFRLERRRIGREADSTCFFARRGFRPACGCTC